MFLADELIRQSDAGMQGAGRPTWLRHHAHVAERDVLASRLAYLTVGLPTVGAVGAVVYADLSTVTWCPTSCCSLSCT